MAPGNYFITTGLHSAETHNSVCYDWWNDATLLKITAGTSFFSGITNFDSEVTVNKDLLSRSAFQKILADKVFSDAPFQVKMSQENTSKYFLSGWYDTEEWKGKTIRWTSREAVALLRSERTFSKIHIRAMAVNSNLSQFPLAGTVAVNGYTCGAFELKNEKWTEISLPLSEQVEGIAKIKIVLDRTWKPRSFQKSNDNRELGMAVESIGFS